MFKQIVQEVFGLAKNPTQQDCKKLRSGDGKQIAYYRKDVGEYRIIYHWNESTLYITVIAKRNDGEVYKLFERKK